jgi:hypothetical protein
VEIGGGDGTRLDRSLEPRGLYSFGMPRRVAQCELKKRVEPSNLQRLDVRPREVLASLDFSQQSESRSAECCFLCTIDCARDQGIHGSTAPHDFPIGSPAARLA